MNIISILPDELLEEIFTRAESLASLHLVNHHFHDLIHAPHFIRHYINFKITELGEFISPSLKSICKNPPPDLTILALHWEAFIILNYMESVKSISTYPTLTHMAAFFNEPALLKFFLPVGDINAKDARGETPLHYAVNRNHPACIDVLLAAHAPLEYDHLHNSPLHTALKESLPTCVDRLMRARTLNREDCEVLISTAVQRSNYETLQVFFSYPILDSYDKYDNLLAYISLRSDTRILKLVLEQIFNKIIPPQKKPVYLNFPLWRQSTPIQNTSKERLDLLTHYEKIYKKHYKN